MKIIQHTLKLLSLGMLLSFSESFFQDFFRTSTAACGVCGRNATSMSCLIFVAFYVSELNFHVSIKKSNSGNLFSSMAVQSGFLISTANKAEI